MNNKMRNNYLALLLVLLTCSMSGMAQEEQPAPQQQLDSIEVSLLTCTPGPVAYSMYGHSALRVHNFTEKLDLVFNYGVFDYNEDNFVFKFVKGETDYILGAEYTVGFFGRYADEEAGVLEQVLNLTNEETNAINDILMENLQPANRMYRYNWLYDNCTTRARDALEKAVQGEIRYMAADKHLTARQILSQFNAVDRWIEFGENFILGYELDNPLTKRQQMFIPSYYAADVDSAIIRRNDGRVVPLVKETRHPLQQTLVTNPSQVDWPMWTFVILFVIIAVVGFFELRRVKTFKWLDVALSFMTGLAGILVAFLHFFSEHAGVNTNILVILFNPLAFAIIPFVIRRKTQILSYAILAVFVVFFITYFVVRQYLDPAIWPLALTLLLRVVVNISVNHKKSLSLQTK